MTHFAKHFFRLLVAASFTTSAFAVSKQETLGAITHIWENLGSCESGVSWVKGHFFRPATLVPEPKWLPGMKKGDHVGFIIFARDHKDRENPWFVSFNPSDLDSVSYRQSESRIRGQAVVTRQILFQCQPNRTCAYFSGWDKWQDSAALQTCASETDIRRINAALQHLKKFYKPTAKLPF